MDEDLILLGRITKTHGFGGAMVFVMNTFKTEVVGEPQWIFVERYGERVPYFINRLTIVDDSALIIELRDVEDETQARSFVGSGFYLPEDKVLLKETEQIMFAVEKGWKVFDKEFMIGNVSEVIDNNSQILLSVMGEGKELLIPFVDDFLIDYDSDKKIVVLDLPDGLVDL